MAEAAWTGATRVAYRKYLGGFAGAAKYSLYCEVGGPTRLSFEGSREINYALAGSGESVLWILSASGIAQDCRPTRQGEGLPRAFQAATAPAGRCIDPRPGLILQRPP